MHAHHPPDRRRRAGIRKTDCSCRRTDHRRGHLGSRPSRAPTHPDSAWLQLSHLRCAGGRPAHHFRRRRARDGRGMTAARRTALLDVNVLIALAWPNHAHHAAARQWFSTHAQHGWATTPITESGFVRVSSNRAAIPTATSPVLALEVLTAMTGLDRHEFWVDDVAR